MRSTTSNVLPASFVPNEHTIIIGRGRIVKQHSANRKFDKMIEGIASEYLAATCKADKGMILSRLIDQIHDAAPEAGFVKKDPSSGRWYTVEESLARTTAAQALRNYLSNSYRSSKQFKQKRRLQQIQQQQQQQDQQGQGSSTEQQQQQEQMEGTTITIAAPASASAAAHQVARCVSPLNTEEDDHASTSSMSDAKAFDLLEATFGSPSSFSADAFQPRPIAPFSLPNLKQTVVPVPQTTTKLAAAAVLKPVVSAESVTALKKTLLLPKVTPPAGLSLAQRINLLKSNAASLSLAVPTVAV